MKIGIDPGLSGAVALLDGNDKIDDLIDMPVMASTGKRQQVNGAELAKIIKLWQQDSEPITAYVEQVSAMPGQGVSSMFSFGKGCGVVEGVMAALGVPVVYVSPGAWKRRAGLIGKPKDMSRTLAQRLYPLAELGRKKDIGRAESILIAKYGAKEV